MNKRFLKPRRLNLMGKTYLKVPVNQEFQSILASLSKLRGNGNDHATSVIESAICLNMLEKSCPQPGDAVLTMARRNEDGELEFQSLSGILEDVPENYQATQSLEKGLTAVALGLSLLGHLKEHFVPENGGRFIFEQKGGITTFLNPSSSDAKFKMAVHDQKKPTTPTPPTSTRPKLSLVPTTHDK